MAPSVLAYTHQREGEARSFPLDVGSRCWLGPKFDFPLDMMRLRFSVSINPLQLPLPIHRFMTFKSYIQESETTIPSCYYAIKSNVGASCAIQQTVP